MDAIASLPLMDDFQLAIENLATAAIPLERLSGLRKFAIRGLLAPSVLGSLEEVIGNSPDLSHLVITVPDSSTFSTSFSKTPPGTSLPLRHLTVKAWQLDLNPIRRHLIDLNSFNLEYFGVGDNVYLDLARARLFCNRLIVHHVHPAHPALLNYLSQCSGTLQELSVLSLEDPDGLAGRFWATVLPEHAATLQVLNICCEVGGEWGLSDDAVHSIMHCSQLRSLTLTIDPFSVGPVRLTDEDSFVHDYDQGAFDKIVSLLLSIIC